MEGIDIANRRLHCLLELIAQAAAGLLNFFCGDFQRTDFGFIKLRAVFTQRAITVGFDVVQNLGHRTGDAVGGGDGRAHQQRLLLFGATAIPVNQGIEAHGDYSIIFSIGSTRIELAPRDFSFSMVSQNRVSLLTMCIATRC